MPVTEACTARRRPPTWAGPVATGGLALAGCLVLAVVDPETRAQFSPVCPFRQVTGLDCPSCGATRAAHALLRGQPLLALDHHALLVLALPVLLLGWTAWLRAGLGRRAPLRVTRRAGLLIAGSLTTFWVLRNLPLAPMSWLGSGAG